MAGKINECSCATILGELTARQEGTKQILKEHTQLTQLCPCHLIKYFTRGEFQALKVKQFVKAEAGFQNSCDITSIQNRWANSVILKLYTKAKRIF